MSKIISWGNTVVKEGTKVKLRYMDDPQAPPVGTVGIVTHIDDVNTIHVAWENGSSLGLVFGIDKFEVLR